MQPNPNMTHLKQYPNKLLNHHYATHLGLVSCKICSRFETPGFIRRHERLAHREESGQFQENEVKFPEKEESFPEKEAHFPENEAQFPGSEASVQESGDAFEEVELGGGIKVGAPIQILA